MRHGLLGALAALVLATPAFGQVDPELAARIQSYERLHAETGDGGVLWVLAEAYAAAGRKDEAVQALNGVADLRMGFYPTADSPVARLAGHPGYEAALRRLDAAAPKVARGRPAFIIDRPGLTPEGLAYDPAEGRLFVGDMAGREILAVGRDGGVSVFASGLALRPLGLKVDAGRRWLWAATTNAFSDASDKRGDLVAYDLSTGRQVGSWTHPEAISFNDLDVAPNGDVYVTDSAGGAVYRLRDGAMDRLTPAGGMGYPNGIAVDGQGRHVFVAQGAGLRRIEVASGEVSRVASPRDFSPIGVDGLYWKDGGLIAVQNVGTPGRVLRLRLSAAGDRIEAVEPLHARDPVFDIPTTGAVAGDRFYLLANAQIDRLRGDGSLDPAKPLAPIRILEIPLG